MKRFWRWLWRLDVPYWKTAESEAWETYYWHVKGDAYVPPQPKGK